MSDSSQPGVFSSVQLQDHGNYKVPLKYQLISNYRILVLVYSSKLNGKSWWKKEIKSLQETEMENKNQQKVLAAARGAVNGAAKFVKKTVSKSEKGNMLVK